MDNDEENSAQKSDDTVDTSILNRRHSGAKQLIFQKTGKTSKEYRTWFRGKHTNRNPTIAQMLSQDAAVKFVLKGWLPEQPIINSNTQVTAFGSCFAVNISNWLSKRSFRVLNKTEEAKGAYVVSFGEGMVNSFVILQQFEWAWENKVFEEALWHDYRAQEYGYDPKIQAETKKIFDQTDVFILTFGLSEVWYDEPTGNVFWRTIPKDAYDPMRHKFRVSSVEENRDNLRKIYSLIRKHRPDAKTVFTLSPIPLIATFRDNSCLTSNSVSKSVLRVAIDEVMREFEDDGHLYYWPSYELVTDVFKSSYFPDRRHIERPVLDFVMTLFEHTWCDGNDAERPSLNLAWARACASANLLPPAMARCILRRKVDRLKTLKEGPDMHGDPQISEELRILAGNVIDEWNREEIAVNS